MVTNSESGTRIDEIADGIYRISTPVPPESIPGGFTFNQDLVKDDDPMLYHTGLKKMFPLVCGAVAAVLPVESLRWIAFSHYEADECGALNQFLDAAPRSEPLCGSIAKMVSVDDVALRPAWPTARSLCWACMHGSAWKGDGADLLRRLTARLAESE